MYTSGLLILCLASFAAADLRMASQPKEGYWLRDQGTTPWKVDPWTGHMHYRYMEPSTFGYKGLEHQKKRNYDNFLRSNIDNEQDNRHFEDEAGKDHLPFRTYETSVFDEYQWSGPPVGRRRRGTPQPISFPISLPKVVKPGDSMLVPLRWNNPHAAEMEINIWIFEHASKQPIVVPIRKPSCSGEGHQDNIVSFTVPKDFSTLGSKIPGFKGCKEDSKPMCTLQIYSHSVESRTYAIGFPIVIPDHDESRTTTSSSGIKKPSEDPWLDLSGLRDICLPATDPSATISTAAPRWARQVSDVFNHAYQNSDYSPYSGQQQEHISKNLQASAVNKMEVGNRGELGKSILPHDASRRLSELRRLEDKIYKNYEALANKIIKSIEAKGEMQSTGTIGVQPLATCFRCKEGGSTTTKRLETNTYIPSFQLPNNLVADARKLVPEKYKTLITDGGLVQIYVASMNDLMPFFFESRYLGITYQDAIVKTTTDTMPDATNFTKRDAEGKTDRGVYASREAKKKFVAERGCPRQCLYISQKDRALLQGTFVEPEEGKQCSEGSLIDNEAACKDLAGKVRTRDGTGTTWKETGTFADDVGAGCMVKLGSRRRYAGLYFNKGGKFDATGYAVCKRGEDRVERPLFHGSHGTNTKGPCAHCAQFFGKDVRLLHIPKMTPLADIVKNGGEPPNAGTRTLPGNPDGALLQNCVGEECDSKAEADPNILLQKAVHVGLAADEAEKATAVTDGGEYEPVLGEYKGCYINSGSKRIHGHRRATFDECMQKAAGSGKAYFGLEYPQCCSTAGQSECLVLDALPSMTRAPDSECEAEGLFNGNRLGDGYRLAVYGPHEGQAILYRMVVTKNNGAKYWCLAELSFYDQSGEQLTTTSNMASAQSEYHEVFAARKAFNGHNDEAGFYCSKDGAPSGWLQYKFYGADVKSYKVRRLVAKGDQSAPVDWTMQVSEDSGSTWQTVHTQSGQWGDAEQQTFDLKAS